MAPQLRSRRRAATDSRPATPLDASQTNSFAESETPRPAKQRKTGASTRVSAEKPASEPPRQRQRKAKVGPVSQQTTERSTSPPTPAGPWPRARSFEEHLEEVYAQNPGLPPSDYKDPPRAKLRPTFMDHGYKRGGIFQSQFPLGQFPTQANLKTGKLLDEEQKSAPRKRAKRSRGGRVTKRKSKSKQPTKVTNSAGAAEAFENAVNESTSASSSSQEPVTTQEGTPVEESQDVTEDEQQEVQHSRLQSGHTLETDGTESAKPTSVPSPIPYEPKCSKERLAEIMGAAISRAEARNDAKVVNGLRWMLEASASDPFLLKTIDDVVAEPTPDNTAVFQVALRDAIKSVKAGKPATAAPDNDMGREDSTSSLSTAKSLKPDFRSASSGPANGPAPPADQPVQTTGPEVLNQERAGTTGSGVTPTRSVLGTKRKAGEEDSQEGEESEAPRRFTTVELAEKKAELKEGQEFPGYRVKTSNCRTRIRPQPQHPRKRVRRTDDDDDISVGTADAHRSTARPAELDNIDFCRKCNGTGNLLCCDGCVDSFHFACLDPPLDSNSPPDGLWYCPSCEKKGPGAVFEAALEAIPRASYQVPSEIRDEFAEVQTEDDGTYLFKRQEKLPPTATNVHKLDVQHLEKYRAKVYVERDANGQLIFCSRCHRANLNGERQIIKCDHCSLYWHLDCLDDNYTHPPLQFQGSNNPRHYWKCPNHLDNMLDNLCEGVRLRRRRRHQEHADLEILPSSYDTDNFHEEENYGKTYRVSERGIVLKFLERIRRDYAETKALLAIKAAEDQARALLVPTMGAPTQSSSGVVNTNNNADADAALSLTDLRNAEAEGALALLAMASSSAPPQQPASGRVGQLVSQLVAELPEPVSNSTSEIDLLQSLQGLIGQRLSELATAVPSDATN